MRARAVELVDTADGGVAITGEPIRWWNHPRFRLVPLFDWRPGDRWNRDRWCFDWLGLGVWTKDTPNITLEVTLGDQGLELRAEPPYLHVRWRIPLFPRSWSQKTWRKGPA